jgi:hypothetical protein
LFWAVAATKRTSAMTASTAAAIKSLLMS